MNLDKLKSDNFFNSIIKIFPRWSNIRKRPKSSDGGLFLYSIAQEFDDIAKSLNEYKKDFFLLYCIGKEDTIIDYLYVGHVGENDNLVLANDNLTLTTDAKYFYENKRNVLCQKGYLFVHPDDITSIENKTLKYKINNITYGIILNIEHIWNVFDEFAMFAGLKRYKNETNKKLAQRVLNNFKYKPSSTNAGLKNAIINAISQDEMVSEDEINIENINADNAFLNDESLNQDTIYDYISYLNQDVYKTKKWDISDWEHAFKTMKFIPTKWDEKIENIQNGVGDNNSLIVLTGDEADEISGSKSTNVIVNAYDESEYKINEYVRNNNIKKDISLELLQYQDELNPFIIDYKIVANNVVDIKDNVSKIYFNAQKKVKGTVNYYLQDLIIDSADTKNLSVNDMSALKQNTDYELIFTPTSNFSEMIISKCCLDKVSLLKEKNEFKLNQDNQIYNTNVKLHASSIDNVTSSTDIVNIEGGGITLKDAATPGNMTIDISGMGGNYLFVDSSCSLVDITNNSKYISAKNMIFTSDNQWINTDTKNDNILIIDGECNNMTFKTIGNCSIVKYENDKLISTNIYADPQSIDLSYNKTTHVKIVITRLGTTQLVVSNININRYDIDISLENGSLIKTGMGIILPVVDDNKLFIKLTAGTSFAPVINFIHIGANLKNSEYKIDFNTGKNVQYIDIDSTCNVKLVENPGSNQTVYNNYIPKKVYTNNTADRISVKIDMNNFYSIQNISTSLYNTVYNGSAVNYIEIEPGQTIDKITATGILFKTVDSSKLIDILESLSEISYSDMTGIFVTNGMKGIIVKSANSEKYVRISKNDISRTANIIKVVNLTDNLNSVFIIDDKLGTEVINNNIDVNFEYFSIGPKNNIESIAYNQYKTVLMDNKNIAIVDQFSPSIPKNTNMLYQIESVNCNGNAKITIYFVKDEGKQDIWSIGLKELNINIVSNSSKNCKIINNTLTEEFQLSNTIDLNKSYTVDGIEYELAKYIISDPDKMKINYTEKEYQETILVNENGFNKLYYSNITSIVSMTSKDTGYIVSPNMYNTLSNEGIISWENEFASNNKTKEIIVDYKYKMPTSLSFSNISDMYDVIGYSVDAYKLVDGYPKTYTDINDGGIISSCPGKRITAYCSNPNYVCTIDNSSDTIRVNKMNASNNIIVKSGTFYYNGLEYYHYADKEETKFDRMSHITTHNVSVKEDGIDFSMQSSNFLPDSSMKTKRQEEICIIDFKNNNNIKGISSMNSLGACESFNGWYYSDMDISFVNALNGYGIKFDSKSIAGFACIDITAFVSLNKIVTLSKKDDIIISIGRSILCKDMPYTRSVSLEIYDNFNLDNNDKSNILWYKFNSINEKYKYYIIVQGSGVLDDIIIKDGDVETDESYCVNGHVKNIDLLGFNIEETKPIGYTEKFILDDFGSYFDRLELTSDNVLRTGASMDWGLTKIFGIDNGDWSKCTYTAIKERAILRSVDDENYVITPAIYIKNIKSVKNIQVKVNELVAGNMKGFNIQLLTSKEQNGSYTNAKSVKNNNVLSAGSNRLLEYIKVKITMPKGKVINNIETFVEYVENSSTVLRSIPYRYGTMTSKIYDIGSSVNVRAKKINFNSVSDIDKIFFNVRGCRTDNDNIVWTEWKQINIDSDTLEIKNNVEFEDYSLFQFKISIYDENANINLESIDFEVI